MTLPGAEIKILVKVWDLKGHLHQYSQELISGLAPTR